MGADIRLEPFAERHIEGLSGMLDDPDVLRYTRVPDPTPPNFPQTWFAGYERGRRDGTRQAFAIEDASDGSFLGIAVAPHIDQEARTAELGYVVAPWARGRGVATAGLRQLTAWALAELDPVRLELLISVDNPASKRVARRGGYRFEGILRQTHFKQDLWEDSEVWSRLASDPDDGEEAEKRLVLEALDAFVEAMRRRDVDAVVDLFVDELDISVWGSDQEEQAVGKPALRSLLEGLAASPGWVEFRYPNRRVHVFGSLAWLNASGSATMHEDDGSVSEIPYRVTGVLMKTQGGWRWHTYHGSEPSSGQETQRDVAD